MLFSLFPDFRMWTVREYCNRVTGKIRNDRSLCSAGKKACVCRYTKTKKVLHHTYYFLFPQKVTMTLFVKQDRKISMLNCNTA